MTRRSRPHGRPCGAAGATLVEKREATAALDAPGRRLARTTL